MQPQDSNGQQNTPNNQSAQPNKLPTPVVPTNEVHDYLHPIVDQPKRAYHPKAFRTILIVVVALSLIGVGLAFLAAYLPMASRDTDKPADDKVATVPTKKLDAKEAVTRMKAQFAGTLAVASGISTPIKVSGNNFYTVVPDVAPVLGVADNVELAKVQSTTDALHKALASYGLTRQVISDGTGTSNYQADYIHADLVCQVIVAKTADVKAPQLVEGKCLDVAAYVDYSSAQRAFYNVYSPAQATSSEVAFTGKPEVKASATAGYQLAELPVSSVANGQIVSANVRAMFYQTPSGIWYYFKDRAQKLIECEQYGTDILKNAYVGQPCHSLAKDIDTVVTIVKKR